MLNKMSETQRSALLTAAERDDRIVAPPTKARAPALKAFADKLVEAGWARLVKARNGASVWRKEAESGQTYALQLTAKGVKVLAKSGKAPIEIAPVATGADAAKSKGAKSKAAMPDKAASDTALACDPPQARSLNSAKETTSNANDTAAATAARAPRANSKIARVLDMLASETGATISDLTAATGWLEHTTRAALTGLRRRGYALTLTRNARDGASVYRAAAAGGGGEAAK